MANYDQKSMKRTDMDEKKIVSGILSGDIRKLRFFYRHFRPSLYTYINRRVDNPADAEEILQDTFLATVEGLRDFAYRSSLFTYICAVANHKIVDFYRRKKIKSLLFSRMVDIEPLLASVLDPDRTIDEEFLRQKIRLTFAQIAPRYGQILKLKYIEGYSVGEIAEKLALSFKSAESQLFRARKAFAIAYSR